jgi:hypothetical protein
MLATITMCVSLFIQSPIELDRATTYNVDVEQCDNDPLTTADGSRIDTVALANGELRWCALSRDLIYDEERQKLHDYDTTIFRGFFLFGDTIVVESISSPQINGKWCVRDCMNKRYKRSIDFLFDPRNNKPKLGVCPDVRIIKDKL